jgi:dihydroorotate dehydrogenase (NAD+) catalytic subunit
VSTGTAVQVGSLSLPAPVMTASGTAGHGAELAPYFDLSSIGAVVTKSLAAYEWAGNPAPRVHPAGVGMINAVGLQGPGVPYWLQHELPELLATGARVVASIWGRSVEDYRAAAEQLANAPAGVVAVEVNLSCPNLEGRRGIFAHDPELSAAVMAASAACGRPRWAKLSPNTDRVVEVAEAVHAAGAEAVTLSNTLLGMVLDPATGLPVLGAGGGGYSGRPVHAVAVRTIFDVRAALPELPIVGVGGSGQRVGRSRTVAGRRERRAGRHGHLRQPEGARPGAGRALGMVRRPRHRPRRSHRSCPPRRVGGQPLRADCRRAPLRQR